MKKFGLEELFNDFLTKMAKDLYEWFLFLYYCWLIVHSKKMSFQRGDESSIMDARFPPDYDAIESYEGVRDSLEGQADIRSFRRGLQNSLKEHCQIARSPISPGNRLKNSL